MLHAKRYSSKTGWSAKHIELVHFLLHNFKWMKVFSRSDVGVYLNSLRTLQY